ncbi:MAG: type II secretion system F family protein, partial [Halobacteria archaeon]|nr:type II secretion system F family protein [Halobacteria archaeon]
GTASFDDLSTQPVASTTWLVVLPTLIAVTPLSILHEVKKHREKKLIERFPDKLNGVANANKMGLSLTESLKQVSRRSAGVIENEFQKVYNDIRWNYVTADALVGCANRLRIPQISRSMNLIAQASHTTGELDKILDVAANDTWNERDLRKERYREMSGYIAVIIMVFLVYLGIILMLDLFYLTPLAESIAQSQATGVDLPEQSLASFTTVPISLYKTLFYHSVLIQAFGNGLLAGKMGENDLVGGLKYSIGFVLLSVIAFAVLV